MDGSWSTKESTSVQTMPAEPVPTSRLDAFRGLALDGPARKVDPETYSAFAVTFGIPLLGILTLAGLTVITFAGASWAVNMWVLSIVVLAVVGAVALVALVSAGMGIVRASYRGGRVRSAVGGTFAVGWVVTMAVLFTPPGDAVREDGQLTIQGWATYASLQPGDCLRDVTSELYSTTSDSVYATPCAIAHRGEVANTYELDPSIATQQAIDAAAQTDCESRADFTQRTTGPDAVAVLIRPTASGRDAYGLSRILCVVVYDTPRKAQWVLKLDGE